MELLNASILPDTVDLEENKEENNKLSLARSKALLQGIINA
jgi:hypothetical protein